MAHDVFVSYSSPDQPYANAICKTLEDAGVKCWIAPRDLTTGARWGGSIVEAIQASKAILVVFSEHADTSPQVAREMEVAVNAHLQPIPIRVADATPTGDMAYFLGVSHWFDAYPNQFRTYLPQILQHTRQVLAGESSWKRFSRRMPGNRGVQFATVGVAVLAVAITAFLMRPTTPVFDPTKIESPLVGRWQSNLKDAQGRVQPCVMDVQGMGAVRFSDTCPQSLAGEDGNLNATNVPGFAQAYSPNTYNASKDDGTYQAYLPTGVAMSGSYRIAKGLPLIGTKHLYMHDATLGDTEWTPIKADTPIQRATDAIVPAGAQWPLKDVPAIAQRVVAYARAKWQPDGVLMDVRFDGGDNGFSAGQTIDLSRGGLQMTVYSPAQKQMVVVMPGLAGITLMPPYPKEMNASQAIPGSFVDLPDALGQAQAHGMRAQSIKTAELQYWALDSPVTGRLQTYGMTWSILPAFGDMMFVPAVQGQGRVRCFNMGAERTC